MQLRLIPAIIIFLGSYLPLSLILLIQDYDFDNTLTLLPLCSIYKNFKHPTIALIFMGTCVICFCVAIFSLKSVKPRQKIVLTEAKYVPADLINYTLPYVVSFMNLEYKEPEKFLGFFIFLIWMFLISYRSGQIIFNPVLIVLGWRLYDIKFMYLCGNKSIFQAKALTKLTLESNKEYLQSYVQEISIIGETKENVDGRS